MSEENVDARPLTSVEFLFSVPRRLIKAPLGASFPSSVW